jgi:CRISP-associated protein Cas1
MMHKDRIPFINLEYGKLTISNGNLHFIMKDGEIDVPIEQFSMINLGCGTSVTHAAIELVAKHGTLLNWIGDGGVRLYSSGLGINARTDRLWKQMEMALNKNKRLSIDIEPDRTLPKFEFWNYADSCIKQIEQTI